ncbi:MAG TPA: hypothetical protein VKT78_16090 [Fimbriimonadaceae bacterium]|nr:hypothetical protein [Fimbriimonadaceae bacterium]
MIASLIVASLLTQPQREESYTIENVPWAKSVRSLGSIPYRMNPIGRLVVTAKWAKRFVPERGESPTLVVYRWYCTPDGKGRASVAIWRHKKGVPPGANHLKWEDFGGAFLLGGSEPLYLTDGTFDISIQLSSDKVEDLTQFARSISPFLYVDRTFNWAPYDSIRLQPVR